MLQGLARGLRVSSGKAAAAGCWSLIEQQILFANVSRLQLVRSLSSSRKDDVFQMKEADDGNNDGDKHPRAKTLDFKQKIYLKDQFGRMLGLKTRQEADLVASKNKLILVEDDTTKKIPTLRLMNPRKVNTDADVLPESTGQESDVEDHPEKRLNKKIPSKQLMFGAKLTDHDLITKIRQVKRWASKNFETVIRVHSQAADFSRMEHICAQFESQFNAKTGCKINQKRITETSLKFNIVPVDKALLEKAFKDDLGEDEHFELDMDNIDPNQLLNDETILTNKDKK